MRCPKNVNSKHFYLSFYPFALYFFRDHSQGLEISHTELFSDGASVVMIEGEGGSGKSTLVRKLCHDWASPPKGTESQYFIHIFYIVLLFEGMKLAERGLDECLDDMIGSYSTPCSNM